MAGRGIAWLHVSVVALAVSVSAPVSAFAQAGALAGQVLDADGDPLPGVTVEVADPLLINPSRRSLTNAQGRYRIPDLRPGLQRWTPSAGQLIDVAKWNLLRYIPVKMRGAEDDKEETAKPFASL